MEASLAYFDETLNRLNASLGQLEGMMGRVLRLVDLAERRWHRWLPPNRPSGVFNVLKRGN